MLWPAPVKFPDGAGGVSYGYHDQVVLPLRIIAKNADTPVTLRAAISYAVCEKLCLPVEAQTELKFVSEASTADGAIAAALDTVPKPAKIGDANPVAIRDVRRDGKTGVAVDVVAPEGKTADLFAEGPTPDWSLPSPKLVKRDKDVQHFTFELDGLPSGADPAAEIPLKLTLTGDGRAYEYNITLK